MNRLKSILAMLAFAVLAIACQKEQSGTQVEYLDVTPNNISGKWKLVEWNGEPLAGGTYFYIEFVRKDRTFTIWQNFDSMGQMPHEVTGEYNVIKDYQGSYLRGMYDNAEGYWAHDYYVLDLTATSMTMVALDDETFVQKFIRVNPLP